MTRTITRSLLFSVALLAAVGCKEKEAGTGPTTGTSPTTTASGGGGGGGGTKLVSFSYDPTRELYKEFNPAFVKHWQQASGKTIEVETVHGPSGSQAQSIIAGNAADIAALSVDIDIDKIAQAGLINKEWRTEFPNDSVPYSSAVVFLVRKGNSKGIKDWADLARDDVSALAPDPKTGGGARWIYLSAWAHVLRKGGDEAAAREFTRKVYDKAILDPAMRGSTSRFVKDEGDVLFGWENEILQIVNDPKAAGQYEIVLPSDSIVIEVPIAVVDKNVDQRGTRRVAEEYVRFLFSDAGQDLVAKYYNRPWSESVARRHADKFPPLKLFRFKEHFTTWPEVMKRHFDTGGELDKMRGG